MFFLNSKTIIWNAWFIFVKIIMYFFFMDYYYNSWNGICKDGKSWKRKYILVWCAFIQM